MKIKELREKANLSQKDVAEILCVDQSAISQRETGVSIPRSDKLPELAKIFGCSIDALYGEEK